MLKAARQKQLAARQAAQANAGQTLAQKNQQANKPAPTKKPVQQKPGQPRPGQPRPGQPRPGQPGPGQQGINNKVQLKRTAPQQLKRTPSPAPVVDSKKEKKNKESKKDSGKMKEAKPQMMKFSQWIEPPQATLEEDPIIEVKSELSDTDFEALITGIQSDIRDNSQSDPRFISDLEFEDLL